MAIPQEILDEFKALVLKKKGIQLTDEQALEECTQFFNLMDILTRKPSPLLHDTKGTV